MRILLLLITTIFLITNELSAEESSTNKDIKTRYGAVTIRSTLKRAVTDEIPDFNNLIIYNNNKIYEESCTMCSVEYVKTYKLNDTDVLLLAFSQNGSIGTFSYSLLSVSNNHAELSESFVGPAFKDIKISSLGNKLIFEFVSDKNKSMDISPVVYENKRIVKGSEENVSVFDRNPSTNTSNSNHFSKKDIKRIRLGMEANDVISVFPGIRLQDKNDYNIRNNNPEYIKGGAGSGWGEISDWKIALSLTTSPYGNGVYFVNYYKFFNEKVDPKVFIKSFKSDLIAKYGKPTVQNIDKQNNYKACWGAGCNNSTINLDLHSTYNQSKAVAAGKIKKGEYLIAYFSNNNSLQEINITMFTTDPYIMQYREETRKTFQRSKTKINF